MSDDEYGFEFDFDDIEIEDDEPEEEPTDQVIERLLEGNPPSAEGATAAEDIEGEKRRTVQVYKTMSTSKKMKLLSESALDDALDWHLEEGVAYHCISFGDVDSLTYLRHVLRQDKLEYVMISTWCMAMEDAEEIAKWVERGMIGRVDFYVGEIFKNGYRGVRDAIEALAEFYKEFFDGINSFDPGFEDWEPYQLGGEADARAEGSEA